MSAIDRSLALGVCESVQAMDVSSRKRKSRADRVFSIVGWCVFVAFCGLSLAAAAR